MQLHEKIYQLRTEKGMSQGDLADALGVSRQSVSKWETGTAVPELDKLIKLSEVFGVTLDELVMDKKPERKAEEPRTVYVERRAPVSGAKITGIVLLCFGALVWLLVTLLGDFLSGLVMALPFAVCGLICLLVRKHIGLWCCWALYLMADIYLRIATGVSWGFVFNPFYYTGAWSIHLIVAWCQLAVYAALVAVTVVRLSRQPRPISRRTVCLAALGWLLFVLLCLPLPLKPEDSATVRMIRILVSGRDCVKGILLAVDLTVTVALLRAWLAGRKKT